MSAPDVELDKLAISRIREALITLAYAGYGEHEDEAHAALEELDALEARRAEA